MNAPWYATAALCISAVAVFVATKNYRRKSGVFVRGSFSIGSSIECNDHYVTNIILENLKDRAVTIFAVYLRVGHNYYIKIEDLESKPLILKPFETYQHEYGPIQFYGINTSRIKLDELLRNDKIKKRLVLSTGDGKYIVPSFIRMWNPVVDYFQNHLTAVVHPIKITHKQKYLGENIKYIAGFFGENGHEEIIPIRSENFGRQSFRNFSLTQESLERKASLELYLNEQLANGKLICKKFVVYDLNSWHENTSEFFKGQTIEAKQISLLYYHILGRFFTWYSSRELRKENAKRQSAHTDT